jgi:hypothetical protein
LGAGQLDSPSYYAAPDLVLVTLLPANVFTRLALTELQLIAASGNLNLNFADEAATHAYLFCQSFPSNAS